MKLITLIFLCFIYSTAMSQTNEIPLHDLEGRWYIKRSNFPIWLKGDRLNPTFNYKVVVIKGTKGLSDEVIYEKKGKLKSIKGFDKPLGSNHFVWRGKGLLGLLKSRWNIVYYDQKDHWAIIKFEKTLFTPNGYDVISKEKKLLPEIIKNVDAKLKQSGIDTPLTDIPQQ